MRLVCSAAEKLYAVLEPIVRVVVVLCQSNGADNRIQICRLGEAIFVPLLRVWKNKPTDRLKVMHSLFFLLELLLLLVSDFENSFTDEKQHRIIYKINIIFLVIS